MDPADPTVTYAGWAYKEGSLVKNWKKRFVVVKRRELAYYKTTDHTSHHAQLMGSMRVARVERASGITNGLLISSMEGRQLKIFMDTTAECDRCYNAIAEWCHPAAGGGGRRSSLTSGSAQASAATTDRDSLHAASAASVNGSKMSGWLEKQGQNMPTWKRRYFVLDEGILTYASNESGPVLARHRVLGVRRDRTRPFTLELTLDTGRELRVSGSDEHAVAEWQRAIRQTLQGSPANRTSDYGRPSGGGGFEDQHGGGVDLRGRLDADDSSRASWNNLFGSAPLGSDDAVSDMPSFGRNIRLDFDGENTSFIECEDPGPPAEREDSKPKPKPFSPKAPGRDTIRKMRIEQNLLDSDDEDDIVINRVSSTQQSSGIGSPVPSRRPQTAKTKKKEDEAVAAGACCCVVM